MLKISKFGIINSEYKCVYDKKESFWKQTSSTAIKFFGTERFLLDLIWFFVSFDEQKWNKIFFTFWFDLIWFDWLTSAFGSHAYIQMLSNNVVSKKFNKIFFIGCGKMNEAICLMYLWIFNNKNKPLNSKCMYFLWINASGL